MTPDERKLRMQELLELCYGCHPDPDSLNARLATDPALRGLYEEVRSMAAVLKAASRVEGTAFSEPQPTARSLAQDAPSSCSASSWRRVLLRVAASLLILTAAAPPRPLGVSGLRPVWDGER